MKRLMKRAFSLLALALVALVATGAWYLHGKQPRRDGDLPLAGLQGPVSVRYDARGVPHLDAGSEADLYRALGYVHAQDRLFQMEILRRLARGELAEVLGPALVDTDRLFRSLRLGEHADAYVARTPHEGPAWAALEAYLDGVNQYQASRPAPLEFDLLGIPKRPFRAEDTFSVVGYTAYSFAAAFRTEPVLTYVRDRLGTDYLAIFDLAWQPAGALAPSLADGDWRMLGALADLSGRAVADQGLPQFEGSNAWVIAGRRTASGKPLLAGDPHIRFSVPATWYEAHLRAPGFELYGHYQALNPFASLGFNRSFGWSLTMFQNDDIDLIAERVNPDDPEQVRYHGQWVDLERHETLITVKGAPAVPLTLRRSPHGPLVNDALGAAGDQRPIALWWTFLESPNPLLEAFYRLGRADTLDKARDAARLIHAPGLNVVWANAAGDIGWWAAARLPRRPAGVDPSFILDGDSPAADKDGFQPFEANPREENPARGYIVSANAQPAGPQPIPGYYNLPDRGRRLAERLADPTLKGDLDASRALQLDSGSAYGPRLLAPLLEDLRAATADRPDEAALVQRLAAWDGDYRVDDPLPTLFTQFLYQLADGALRDELGDAFFDALLATRALDAALPRLAADPDSPWWDDRRSPARETRRDIVRGAWQASLAHLRATWGDEPASWTWGRAHTLTHGHPLGRQAPLDRLLNVGPFAMPGTHETPNNQSSPLGPAPWAVSYGPSTRRLIDFADPAHSLGINPVGQSGVPFDAHYADQAADYAAGRYRPQLLDETEIAAEAPRQLRLVPAP